MRLKHLSVPLLAGFVLFGAGCQAQPVQRPDVQPEPVATLPVDTSTGVVAPSSATGTEATWPTVFRSQDGRTAVDVTRHEGVDEKTGALLFFNPFFFDGTTTVFENQFSWRVTDDEGNLIAGGPAYAHSPDTGLPGGFAIKGFYDAIPATTTGQLELYDNSPKDGSEIVLIKLPVLFAAGDKATAQANHVIRDFAVYFSNTQKDPNMQDCSKVYPVQRQAVDDELDQVVEMNLHALLHGPTAAEAKQGYISEIPAGVSDPKIELKGKEVWVEFDNTLEQGMAGSCRVSAVRAQIEQTVKAVYPDSKVVISVDGRTEDILQP